MQSTHICCILVTKHFLGRKEGKIEREEGKKEGEK